MISRCVIHAGGVALALACAIFSAKTVSAGEPLTLLVTSNLEGGFIPDIQGQEERDPMILTGQSIAAESRARRILYLDLGNAFYPGILSKNNYGAAVMDFFSYFDCRATLVSSMDLRLGITALEFLQKGSGTRLLSANITRDGKPVFTPYFIYEHGGKKIGFIGLSSRKILFDIAEQNVYRISLADEMDVLTRTVALLKTQGVNDIVLLSGLRFRETMKLMKAFPEIRIALCGGDNRGYLTGGTVSRVDTADGRTLVSVPPSAGYCLLALATDDRLSVRDLAYKKPSANDVSNEKYREFIRRITLWKKQFADELGITIATIDKPIPLEQRRIASLMRDASYAEIAIVKNDTIVPIALEKEIRIADVLSAVNDNYTVYTYRLSGSDLLKLVPVLNRYTVSGFENGRVQNYPINPRRQYLVISTQTVYEEIQNTLNRKIPYRNTWKTIADMLTEDLKGRRAVLRNDFRYLDRRFRFVADLYLSGFYETSRIIADTGVKVPVGEPSQSYQKWGFESQIDLTLYNNLHSITLTPYINYSRQNDQFLKNLIRGTLLYLLNLNPVVNPYQKSQIESVVLPVRGAASMPRSINNYQDLVQLRNYRKKLRPVIIRETLGMFINTKYLTSSLGCGMEKYIHEPVKPVVFGLEASLSVRYDFLPYLAYGAKVDSFLSVLSAGGKDREKNYLRCEIENALTVKLVEMIGFSVKYRWNFYQNIRDNRRYSNSQFITSCDVRTDFKL